MSFLYKIYKQKSGAALLVILAVSALIIPLIQRTSEDSFLNYKLSRHLVHKTQARLNAEAGLNLALLRLYIFKGADKSLPEVWRNQSKTFLDQIWRLPFMWPFSTHENLLESEISALEEIKQSSFLKGSYKVFIEPEDGRLDVNDLSSPLEFLKNFTYSTLLNLLYLEVQKDERLKEKYPLKKLEEILNNMSDWTDLDNRSQNGGSEDEIEGDKKPLNRSFISPEEIKKVPGMDEVLYRFLEPYITTYGAKSLNINYVKAPVLSAMGLPPDALDQILQRTQVGSEYYQPFSSLTDFCDFSENQGYNICNELIEDYESLDMLSFGSVSAFRIKSIGGYRSQEVQMTALLYDLSLVSSHWQDLVDKEKKRLENPEAFVEDPRNQKPDQETLAGAKEKLKIDYSYHKSLIIMYIKEM